MCSVASENACKSCRPCQTHRPLCDKLAGCTVGPRAPRCAPFLYLATYCRNLIRAVSVKVKRTGCATGGSGLDFSQIQTVFVTKLVDANFIIPDTERPYAKSFIFFSSSLRALRELQTKNLFGIVYKYITTIIRHDPRRN